MKCHSVPGSTGSSTGLTMAPATCSRKQTATLLALGAAALSLWGTSAWAFTNLVQNPSFETNNGTLQFGNNSPYNATTNPIGKIAGWSTKCHSCLSPNTFAWGFIMDDTIATNTNGYPSSGTGTTTQYGGGLWLWGSQGTIKATSGNSFYGGDGDFLAPFILQTISGLEITKQYQLSFDWAQAQQWLFDGDTTEGWKVTFGNETVTVGPDSLPNHGFSGWKSFSAIFTPTTSSQVLEFLAIGTPSGRPPFSLLDNVQLREMPPVPGPLTVLGAAAAYGYSRHLRRRIRRD